MDARKEASAVASHLTVLPVALALLAGTVLMQAMPSLPPRWWDALLAGCACAGIVACWRWRAPVWMVWVPILLLGFAWTAWRADQAWRARLPAALEKQDLVVTGQVLGLPEARRDATRFEFNIADAAYAGTPIALRGRVRLAWYPSRGAAVPAIAPCSTWHLRLRLKRPRGLINPGGLDFERAALQQGIVATGYVRNDPDNAWLQSATCVDGWRARVATAISAALPGDAHSARLLRALAVGDERALDEHDWQVVRATGISHLIAISGFHVGLAAIFGAMLVRLLWWLWPPLGLRLARPLAEAAIALPMATAYGAMAGFGLPTTRTLLMIAVVAGWRLLRRGGSLGDGFGLALAAILIVDPLAVLAAGFWLSFGGVALLAWTLAYESGWRGRLQEIGLAPLLMTLALLPLTVWLFGQASLVAPIANLFAVPVVSFLIVPLNLLACLLLWVWPWAGQGLLQLCAAMVDGMWWCLTHMAAWPAAMAYVSESSLLAFTLACLGAIWLLAPRGIPARALGVALLLPLCWPRPTLTADGAFRATVIDVGQGLAVLLQTREHALLVDAGARFPSGFDLGAAAVVPSLHALGVRHLDGLIISHGDIDHAGGATAVLAAYPDTPTWGGEPARGPVPMQACHAGQHWQWNGVDFRLLWPDASAATTGNDAGCVLLVTGAGGRLLLPADSSSKVEAALAAAVPPGPPLVLIAPHHGSRTSSSRAYLEALRPVFAIASNGYLNAYHHPAAVVAQRYAELGIPLWNTPATGAVRINFPGAAAPRITATERQRQARYWRER